MNFLIGLIVGLIIGWTIELIIDFVFWRRKGQPPEPKIVFKEVPHEIVKEVPDPALEAKLAAAEVEISNLKRKWAETAEAWNGEYDDLKRIEGIGPKIEQILNAEGIKTFQKLSSSSANELRELLDRAGISRISDPTTWPEQAELASAGKWSELMALQRDLKGGRRTGGSRSRVQAM